MLGRALGLWGVMLLLAIANGTFRVVVLIPRLGEGAGHVVSTLLLSALLAALIWFGVSWVRPSSRRAALGLGLLWVGMTIAFEFGFGRFLARKSWTELLSDYDVLHGRIWPLVLVTTGIMPYVRERARRPLHRHRAPGPGT